VIADVKASVVLVGNFETGELSYSGSGFLWRVGDLVVTNKHVVTGSDDKVDACKVVLDSGSGEATVVEVKPTSIVTYTAAKRSSPDYYKQDIAILTLGAKSGKPLSNMRRDPLKETAKLWTAGFPQGTSIRTDSKSLPAPSIQETRVERLERKDNVYRTIQIAGSPAKGSSGGPVFDAAGKVVGVIQAKEADTTIVYAVPIATVEKLLALKGRPEAALATWLEPIDSPKSGVDHSDANKDAGSGAAERSPARVVRSNGQSSISRYRLSESDLEGLDALTLALMRNEPYARRGYRFKRDALRRLFSSYEWYDPWTSDMAAIERNLSSTERYNVNVIARYQKTYGLEW